MGLRITEAETDGNERKAVTSGMFGEKRLALEMINRAIVDASAKRDSRQRRGARLWLQDASATMSARVCFELLGVDYEWVKPRLVKLCTTSASYKRLRSQRGRQKIRDFSDEG